MLQMSYSSKFKKAFKKIIDENVKTDVKKVITLLANKETLDIKYKKHTLKGEYKGFEECHIKPDLLLIYKIQGGEIYFYRLGSHSELF